jgi:hypothetical protein
MEQWTWSILMLGSGLPGVYQVLESRTQSKEDHRTSEPLCMWGTELSQAYMRSETIDLV